MVQKNEYNDFLDIPALADNKSEIFSLLNEGLEKGASDIHLSAGYYPVLRVDNKLLPLVDRPRLTPGYIEKLVHLLLTPEQKETFREQKELDFSYIFKDRAFIRANIFLQKGSVACAIRLIPSEIRSFNELGLPDSVQSFAHRHQGLVLVTGPTGSGKSTTIAAILEEINRTRAAHILTIEDPIEYVFRPRQCIINQREVGRDTKSFKEALRSALREDFDVILIGELRDSESMEAALTIAETGHLVFASVHAGSAATTADRIIDAFPPHYQNQVRTQLANVLLGVIAQRLLPKVHGGRIPATEVMVANTAIISSIKEGKTNQLKSIIETGKSEGMTTFEQSLTELLAQGKVTKETIKALL